MSDLPVSRPVFRDTIIGLVAASTVVTCARLALGYGYWRKSRGVSSTWYIPSGEDVWIFVSWFLFMCVSGFWLNILPAFFRMSDLAMGIGQPYDPTEDGLYIQKAMFFNTICFWGCLWSAKFSLLCMYKTLVSRLRVYQRLWWALVIFCALALFGSYVTLFLACSSLDAMFAVGACFTPRDLLHTAISRWYTYIVDVLTNLLIMALPIRLILGLQMPLSRKLGIASLFCSGWICIAVSTIWVQQINGPGGQSTLPWLAMWGMIEGAVAVITVCGPGIYRAVKSMVGDRKQYYNDDSALSGSGPRKASMPSRNAPEEAPENGVYLQTYTTAGSGVMAKAEHGFDTGSQVELVRPDGKMGIVVKKQVTMTSRPADENV